MTIYQQNNPHKVTGINPTKILGVTLVELMIAITISSIVAIGIGSVYTSSKRSYKLQEQFSHTQENGRFAMDYIARYVRNAGYSGCASGLTQLVNDIDSTDDEAIFQTGIGGYEANSTAPNQGITLVEDPSASVTAANFTKLTSAGATVTITNGALTNLGVLPGSDIFFVRAAASTGHKIIERNTSEDLKFDWISDEINTCIIVDPADPPNLINVNGFNGLCRDNYLVISDCNKAIAFQASDITSDSTTVTIVHNEDGTPGNISAAWGTTPGQLADPDYAFDIGDELLTVATKTFYIGKGINGPSLFMDGGAAAPLELVEGVENMQVLYGIDTDTGTNADKIPNRYVPADQVTDFTKVHSVRLSLLLRSVDNLSWRGQTINTYLLGGATAATAVTVTSPNDQRLRRIMSMTIKIRNGAFSL